MMLALILSMTGCVRVTVDKNVSVADAPADTAVSSDDAPDSDASIEKPALRDTVASPDGLGEDAIIGACLNNRSINDQELFDTALTNFNAVTLENELKPDAMFGYNNDRPKAGSIHEEELDGQVIQVPTLDHSLADAMLERILEWNRANPERTVRVRGHVLVWHLQTPGWFFRTDYDPDKDYVTAEEMNRRLEWYIKSMLTYYTQEGSRYRGLFYAWDVVNEAVSDRTGGYRTEQSDWWNVYQSEEYIINAFCYANRYAPEDLALYYNDYNECDKKKLGGICTLISDVKNADGTRLDGFGMQGHYSVNAPTAEMIADAARTYSDAAGSVMLTELDVKPSMFYDGTESGLEKENIRQADYYKKIYDALRTLSAESVNIRGISFWGVSDKYTWLTGAHPLLFDEDMKPKPAFDAFLTKAPQ